MAHILAECNDTKNDLLRKIVTISGQLVVPERTELAVSCNDSNWDLYKKFLTIVNVITAALADP